MKSFNFQKFSVAQDQKVFRVGTDAVLLGALSNIEHCKKILEIGTGSGIISLMLAQRNPKVYILALEIDFEAVKLAELNFKNSPFHESLEVKHVDFNDFTTDDKFDLIVSNPPYFEENASQKDIIARQQNTLNFTSLIKNSAKLLSENGLFSVIIPHENHEFFVKRCIDHGLNLVRKIIIYGMKNGKARRVILEFSIRKEEIQLLEFIIEKSPRKYSDEYLQLTKDFHLFKNESSFI